MPDDPGGAGGRFVTVEGADGVGKTTLARALASRAEAQGWAVISLREPGGTDLGERIRDLVLHAPKPADPRAELLLFCAARAQLVAERIRPALGAGALVICDRFTDSTVAYQHAGRGLPRAEVLAAAHAATGGLTPDLSFLLDLDPERARARGGEATDHLERESPDFRERVRRGFLDIAREEPDRLIVLDADRPASDLAQQAWSTLAGRLPAAQATTR